MTLLDIAYSIRTWKFTRQKLYFLLIGAGSLLLLEFVARPYYRPYIYKHNYYDAHIADTLGNSLGTFAAIFIFLLILGGDRDRNMFVWITVTIGVVLFELIQPLMGKPIDYRDVIATFVTSAICHFVIRRITAYK